MTETTQFLKDAATRAVGLFREREKINQALETLESDYARNVDSINARFDDLEKAAAENIASIERRYEALIPVLENNLKAATDAFEKENRVLDDLIKQRDGFLDKIRSGFESFVRSFSFEGADAGGIRAQFQDRLKAVQEFAANIRTLVARGLDPTLVREFVSAGVSGAGEAAKALVGASQDDLAAINQVQAGLATEIAGFQDYATQQWFAAGIAQQEAIVAPLAAARDQAAAALAAANMSRATELAAARAHAEQLKLDRQAALAQAKLDYEQQKLDLQAQGLAVEEALKANAAAVEEKMTSIRSTLLPEMGKIGRDAIDGLVRGMAAKEGAVVAEADRLGRAALAAFKGAFNIASPSRETMAIGEQVAMGLAVGMNDAGRIVQRAAFNLADLVEFPITAPTSALTIPPAAGNGGPTVINVTVEANGLIVDPAEVGRQAVEAIRKYERRSGPVFVSAT